MTIVNITYTLPNNNSKHYEILCNDIVQIIVFSYNWLRVVLRIEFQLYVGED